jgi:hypothetical protein
MTRRCPSTVRRLKLVLGALILCRALIAMHTAAIGPTGWPSDAMPSGGLLRATKLLFAGVAADVPDACEEREIAAGPAYGESL